MANYEQERRRKVTRQSWKPRGVLALLRGLWTFTYSILKIALGALATVIVIGGVCLVVFVGTLGDYLQDDIIPNSDVSLDGFELNQNSIVYYLDSDGNIEILQKLYAETNSQRATYEEIPKAMINAAVAIEDKRFFEHQGVDWFTTIKACVNMFVGSGDQFGGSSITQQLIKNLYLSQDETADDVTVQRKVQEIFRATELEKRYDKKVIITWYLNEIYLGNRIYGVKAAAEYYFGKELELLTPAECACLISITNNPSIYDPTSTKVFDYEVTEGDVREMNGFERNHVRKENTLWVMRNEGYLTEEEYRDALAQELVFKKGIPAEDRLATCQNEECGYHDQVKTFVKKNDGLYYCPECDSVTTIGVDASKNVYSWFVDTVLEDVAAVFAERDGLVWNELSKKTKTTYKNLVCAGGYHIYSTLNMDIQEQVDKIYTNLDEIPADKSMQQLQSSMIIIDNATGDIVAMAGGVGEKDTHDGFNRATDAKLQPGSSMKPLSVYAPAFELGMITPASTIKDMPLQFMGDRPFPYNDNRKYTYTRTVYTGIEDSVNAVAVNTLDAMGLLYSYKFAKDRFGLSHLVDQYTDASGNSLSDIGHSPLGMGAPTIGVTVRQMAEAYGTFANNGVRREARTYTKVYNSKGELIISNEQDSEQIISEKTVNYMNYCLDRAVQSGTGTRADLKGQDVCGKTGSTSSMKDRWFCGFTSYYTAAVWCGYDTPEVIKLSGDSGNPAARLFKKVLEPIHSGLARVPMYDPSPMEEITVCLDCGNLATDACTIEARTHNSGNKRTENVMVYVEDIPLEYCSCHVVMDFCESCNAVASEYCKKFAAVGKCNIVKRSLVKMTQGDVSDIAAADGHGLNSAHTKDNYIYLVDRYGNPVNNYKGIHGDKNVGISAPYLICNIHTKEAWDAYLVSQGMAPSEPNATEQDQATEVTEELTPQE